MNSGPDVPVTLGTIAINTIPSSVTLNSDIQTSTFSENITVPSPSSGYRGPYLFPITVKYTQNGQPYTPNNPFITIVMNPYGVTGDYPTPPAVYTSGNHTLTFDANYRALITGIGGDTAGTYSVTITGFPAIKDTGQSQISFTLVVP